jgi:hypothetical protein
MAGCTQGFGQALNLRVRFFLDRDDCHIVTRPASRFQH